MKYRYIIPLFVFAALLIPGVLQYANAQTDELSNDELHQLILDLTDRVEDLEQDLEDANATIDDLQDQIDNLDATSSSDDSDDEEDGDEDEDVNDEDDDIAGDGTGHIVLCHKDKNTIRVGITSLRAHLAHGDTHGSCESDWRNGKWDNNDDESDDSSDDDEEDDDDSSDDDDES